MCVCVCVCVCVCERERERERRGVGGGGVTKQTYREQTDKTQRKTANNSTRAKYNVPYRLERDRHRQKARGRDRLNRSREKRHKKKGENTKSRVYVRRKRVTRKQLGTECVKELVTGF